MDARLKSAVSWTAFLLIVFVIIAGVLFPAAIIMLAPTVFPQADISGFVGWMQTASVIISFASAFLGAFSVWQASHSSKETKDVLDAIRTAIREVKANQDDLASFMREPNYHTNPNSDVPPTRLWLVDPTKE